MSTPQEITIANTDLWSHYFQNEWSRWLNPLGVPAASPVAQVADGTAARIASFLTLVAFGPMAWLYNSKAPQHAEGARTEIPARPLHPLEASESVEDYAA